MNPFVRVATLLGLMPVLTLLALLVYGVIWSAFLTPGLDLYTPSDAREYVHSCARGQDDLYCKAMLPTLRTVTGPVSVMMPNMGDTQRTDLIFKILERKGVSQIQFLRDPSALARANIFALPVLSTGTHRTLDGRAHQVMCKSTQGSVSCAVDGLTALYRPEMSSTAGTVYLTGTVYSTGAEGALPLLPF